MRFRVWCPDTRKFVITPDRDFPTEYMGVRTDAVGAVFHLNRFKPRWVCQYSTELFDSKGIEIFEGDIIKGEFYDTDMCHSTRIESEVRWVKDSAGFNIGSKYWFKPSIRVIGHKYDDSRTIEKPKTSEDSH